MKKNISGIFLAVCSREVMIFVFDWPQSRCPTVPNLFVKLQGGNPLKGRVDNYINGEKAAIFWTSENINLTESEPESPYTLSFPIILQSFISDFQHATRTVKSSDDESCRK